MRFAIALFFAVCAFGADFAGSWKGSLKMKTSDGTVLQEGDAFLNLKQTGDTITGEAGTDDESYPVENGKADGNTLMFSVKPPEGNRIFVTLTLNEHGELSGQANAEVEGRKVTVELKLKK
jgi:hypothetical protein